MKYSLQVFSGLTEKDGIIGKSPQAQTFPNYSYPWLLFQLSFRDAPLRHAVNNFIELTSACVTKVATWACWLYAIWGRQRSRHTDKKEEDRSWTQRSFVFPVLFPPTLVCVQSSSFLCACQLRCLPLLVSRPSTQETSLLQKFIVPLVVDLYNSSKNLI